MRCMENRPIDKPKIPVDFNKPHGVKIIKQIMIEGEPNFSVYTKIEGLSYYTWGYVNGNV